MPNYFYLCLALLGLASCSAPQTQISVSNPTPHDYASRIVEITPAQPSEIAVFDPAGNPVPSQLLSNGNIIFPANVPAGASAAYTLHADTPTTCEPITYARLYTEKMGDLAWENDKIAFRAYGKEYEAIGSTLYGYDLFTKRGAKPVLDALYAPEIDPEVVAKYKHLQATDPEAAAYFVKTFSYHLDHGKGMDYYVVGPTLGCGTSALVPEGGVVYQTYFRDYEILENGPLRTVLTLTYDPVEIAGDMVTEKRRITLDAGTNFNRIEVTYEGLTKPTKVIAGIVLHDPAEIHQITENTVAYVEPMHDSGWQTYLGLIFDNSKMKPVLDMFDEAGRKAHGGAYGHIQAEGVYSPGDTLVYYMGAGWNGWEFEGYDEWLELIRVAGEMTQF
ncbi:MAG: DUF4861 family protein [Rikenellaceae bacterium]